MPRQPEVHFRLKASKGRKRLIYIDFAYNKKRLKFSFGQFIDPADWNSKKEVVKNKQATTTDGKFKLNDLLNELKNICERSVIGISPEPKTLRDAMDDFINQNHDQTVSVLKPTLYDLIKRFINGDIKISGGRRSGREKGNSCLKNYNTTFQRLKDFELAENYLIDFETITKEFFNKYVTYLNKTKQLKPNTIAKDIATIKVFMNEAVDQDLTDNLHFKKKSFSYSEEETDHVYLTEIELEWLYDFDFSYNKKLEQVRDLFIFGSWVGLRFSDYSTIKPENIKKIDGEYFIDMVTQKTGERVIIPCNPVVLDIFNKYDSNPNKLPKSISNQKFNKYIKEVCELAKLNEKGRLSSMPDKMLWQAVSSHTCRRSMITNYYLQGFPTIDLMKISGHKTEANFMKYLRLNTMETAKRMAVHNKMNWSKKLLKVPEIAHHFSSTV